MYKLLSALAAAALLLTAPYADAMFARMSSAELVGSSDSVVEGVYKGTRLNASGVTVGVLDVSKTRAGAALDGEVLIQVKQPGAPISSTDIVFRAGQTGLWFLEAVEGGLYSATHPQRFISSAKMAQMPSDLKALLSD